jgi:hypothetical protein
MDTPGSHTARQERRSAPSLHLYECRAGSRDTTDACVGWVPSVAAVRRTLGRAWMLMPSIAGGCLGSPGPPCSAEGAGVIAGRKNGRDNTPGSRTGRRRPRYQERPCCRKKLRYHRHRLVTLIYGPEGVIDDRTKGGDAVTAARPAWQRGSGAPPRPGETARTRCPPGGRGRGRATQHAVRVHSGWGTCTCSQGCQDRAYLRQSASILGHFMPREGCS